MNDQQDSLGPVLVGFSIWLGIFYVVILWTDRTLEYWLSLVKGHPVEVSDWSSAGVTLVLNGVIVAVNLLSELLRLVI